MFFFRNQFSFLIITKVLNWLSYKITFNFNKITTRCFNNFFPKLISSHQPITRANRYNWFKAHLLWVCYLHMQCNLLHVRTIETRHNTRTMKLVISRLCKSLASALTELRRSLVQSLGCLFNHLVKQTMSLNLALLIYEYRLYCSQTLIFNTRIFSY